MGEGSELHCGAPEGRARTWNGCWAATCSSLQEELSHSEELLRPCGWLEPPAESACFLGGVPGQSVAQIPTLIAGVPRPLLNHTTFLGGGEEEGTGQRGNETWASSPAHCPLVP